ncbi:hypothetical protein FWH09_01875 [Candidatus Saccharibacteria bacterium]|nr:hypothetical protein [Candidatus Saccharibacteria bacterium]
MIAIKQADPAMAEDTIENHMNKMQKDLVFKAIEAIGCLGANCISTIDRPDVAEIFEVNDL